MKNISKIFIVDDSQQNLKAIRKKLEQKLFCEVHEFTTGLDCMMALHQETPDLIIIDFRLNTGKTRQIDGDQLLAILQGEFSHIPIIMYSTNEDINLSVRLQENGVDAFVTKDKNFLEKIVTISKKQLAKVRKSIAVRNTKIMILATVAMITISMFLLDSQKPELLIKFNAILLSTFAIILFLIDPLLSSYKK